MENEDLEFIRQLEPFTEFDEGQNILLECWVNRYDTDAEWFKDNQPMLASGYGKYDIISEDKKHKLLIHTASPDDKAMYTCRVNSYLQTTTILNVNQDVPLKIVRGLFDMHVPEYEKNLEFRVELNKFITNDGQYLIRWFVNKKK